MNANRKTILAIIISCLFSITAYAQASLNLYPLNGTIGLKFFSDKKVSLEPRFDFQYDLASGEYNVFVNVEIFSIINFLEEEKFNLYSGIGLGANIYNQAQSNFSGTVPFGAVFYLNDKKRVAIIGECGIKSTALDFLKIKSYAIVGMQIRLKKH
jgi:hypothetical protein